MGMLIFVIAFLILLDIGCSESSFLICALDPLIDSYGSVSHVHTEPPLLNSYRTLSYSIECTGCVDDLDLMVYLELNLYNAPSGHVMQEQFKCDSFKSGSSDRIKTFKLLAETGNYSYNMHLRVSNTNFHVFDYMGIITLPEPKQFSPRVVHYLHSHTMPGNKVHTIEIGRGTYPKDMSEIMGAINIFSFDECEWFIEIGSFTSIAQDVNILIDQSSSHNYKSVSTYPLLAMVNRRDEQIAMKRNRHMKIGNDVWIGLGSSIINGVTIGDGAVIGAYSVVRSDIPPYAIAVGNPAQVVKYRFAQDIIDKLLVMKWWEWSDEEVLEAMMHMTDVEGFISKWEKKMYNSTTS